MRVNGLELIYKKGVNTVLAKTNTCYPVGDLLCQIFQGDVLYSIKEILRNCINAYPMRDCELTQDEIEEAERYVLTTLLYEDFYPARILAQGCFIRCMEEYRALDSKTAKTLLMQEKQRAYENEHMLLSEIGFNNIGEFLRLCYNNYIIDMFNGIGLFMAMSAVRSGTANEDEQEMYDGICEMLHGDIEVPGVAVQTLYDKSTGTFEYQYTISSFLAMAVYEFSHMAESAIKIRRCQNPECGKFFTAKRASAKYCGFPCPQRPSKACSVYYPQFVHCEKKRLNELDRLIRNARCRLYNARRRYPMQADDINKQLSDIAIFASCKKEQVLNGTMTKNEFTRWLDSHR